MILKSKILIIIIPTILFLGIGASMASGIWNTGDKLPSRYANNEQNSYDPQSISGSYSFADVSEFFNIPTNILYEAFSIPDIFIPSDFKAKNLGSIYESMDIEIGTESVQAFVALYNGLPYDLIDIYLPDAAVNLILEHNTALTDAQQTYLKTHSIYVVSLDPSTITFSEEEESSTDFSIKGPTTIQEVLDEGLSITEFEAIVKKSVKFTNETVKDFCIENGLSFSEIKVALNNAVNSK